MTVLTMEVLAALLTYFDASAMGLTPGCCHVLAGNTDTIARYRWLFFLHNRYSLHPGIVTLWFSRCNHPGELKS